MNRIRFLGVLGVFVVDFSGVFLCVVRGESFVTYCNSNNA